MEIVDRKAEREGLRIDTRRPREQGSRFRAPTDRDIVERLPTQVHVSARRDPGTRIRPTAPVGRAISFTMSGKPMERTTGSDLRHTDMLEFTILQPPKSLLGEVECFRLVTCPAKGRLAIKVCPNGLPGIVFQHRHGQSAIENIVTDSGRVVSTPLLFVHGQITEITVMNFVGPFTTIQAVLKPYALKTLFGLNATELTDGSTTLERLCPGVPAARDLDRALVATNDDQGRIARFAGFLERLVAGDRNRDELVEAGIELISRNIKTVTVKLLHERLGLSERQFERRFLAATGVSPRFFIRVRRVNEAFRLMDTGRFERLSDVAYELNYFDQSHFIRDVKAFSGTTPKSIGQRVIDFHRDRVGSSYLSLT